MSMIINQDFMDNEVMKPIMKKFNELEHLIKKLDEKTKMKMEWMSSAISKLPKTKKRAK